MPKLQGILTKEGVLYKSQKPTGGAIFHLNQEEPTAPRYYLELSDKAYSTPEELAYSTRETNIFPLNQSFIIRFHSTPFAITEDLNKAHEKAHEFLLNYAHLKNVDQMICISRGIDILDKTPQGRKYWEASQQLEIPFEYP